MNAGQGKSEQEARRTAHQRWERMSLVDAMKYRRFKETRGGASANSAVPLTTQIPNSLLTLAGQVPTCRALDQACTRFVRLLRR